MKFEIEFDSDLDLRIVRILSAITYEELAGLASVEEAQATHVMWFIEPGALGELSIEELKRLLAIRRSFLLGKAGGQTLVVADDPSEAMLMKWYKSYADEKLAGQVQLHMCESIDSGKALLRSAAAE